MISLQIDFKDADQAVAFLNFLRTRLKIIQDARLPETAATAAIEAQRDIYEEPHDPTLQ